MNYIIVNWNAEDLRWEVLHYSHMGEDARTQYEKFKKSHPSCKFMIDFHKSKCERTGDRLLAYFDDLFKA